MSGGRTGGHWLTHCTQSRCCLRVIQVDTGVVVGTAEGRTPEEARANARAFAAVPRMAWALKDVLPVLERCGQRDSHEYSVILSALAEAGLA